MDEEGSGPGKFESRPSWVEQAYQLFLDGTFDEYWGDVEGGGHYSLLKIEEADIEEWQLSSSTVAIVLIDNSYGFVVGGELDQYAYTELMHNIEYDKENECHTD